VRYQQGFFTVAQTCPQCRGAGQIIQKPCPKCHGNGQISEQRRLTVKIPAGIATGQRLRLRGEGEGGVAGGPPGNLDVVVQVQEHPFFRREGDDLLCEMPVSFPTLALGGDIKVPTLDGQETVRVPEGTESGTVLRLRGKGMPNVSGRGRGDLHVVVQVITPRKLTREQKRLLEQLAATIPSQQAEPRGREAADQERSVFERVKDIFS
jgi:molecular chaperone DnaJ